MKSIYKQILFVSIGIIMMFSLITVLAVFFQINDFESGLKEGGERIQEEVKDHTQRLLKSIEDELVSDNGTMNSDGIMDSSQKEIDRFVSDVDEIINSATESVDELYFRSAKYLLIALAIVIILTNLVIWILAKRIVKPIKELMTQVRAVGEGDLEMTIHVDTKNEIGKLAEEFDHMTKQVKINTDQKQQTMVAQERMNAEYTFVNKLRGELLPDNAYSGKNYQLYALLRDFNGAGGCFYDYFSPSKNHIALVVGDTSSAGVSSTMLLLLAKTYIDVFSRMGYTPAGVLAETNNHLSRNNDTAFTVNILLCIIDLEAGQMSYICAGAEPLLWKHAGDEFTFLDEGDCLPIGHMENIPYRSRSIRLAQGDTLVLYTQGLSEAVDEKGNRFTGGELALSLNRIVTEQVDCEGIACSLMEEVEEFIGETEQKLERTVITFRYLG